MIGGAPAAAVVFTRDVDARTRDDPRVRMAEAALSDATGDDAALRRAELAELRETVRNEKLGEVAAEFDAIHSVERARAVGSVHRIIAAADLRPELIAAVERGLARSTPAGDRDVVAGRLDRRAGVRRRTGRRPRRLDGAAPAATTAGERTGRLSARR